MRDRYAPRTLFVLRDVMAHSTREAHTRDVAGGVTRERDVGSETGGRCPYYARLFFYFTAAFRQWRTLRVGADRHKCEFLGEESQRCLGA